MKCPYCSKEIEDEVIICRHCNRAVMEPERLGTAEAGHESSSTHELGPEDIEGLLKGIEEEGAEAEPRTEGASPLPPDRAAHHLEQALALEDGNMYGQALEECDAALRLDPTLADAHNLRGVILEELGREREAVLAYREALRLDPGFDAARENLQAVETELQAGEARWQKTTEAIIEEQVVFEAENGRSYYTWQLARAELEPVTGAITVYGHPQGRPAITVPVSEITSCEIVEREDIPRNLHRLFEGSGGGDWGGSDWLGTILGLLLMAFDQVLARGTKVPVLKLTQASSDDSSRGWVLHLRSRRRGRRGRDQTLEMAHRIAAFLRQTGYSGTIPGELRASAEEPEASAPQTRVQADLTTMSRNKWIVGGFLALVLAWAAAALVGSYIWAGIESVSRALPYGPMGMHYGFLCALPVLALSLLLLWILTRGFSAEKMNRSSFIIVTTLAVIIASIGGFFSAVLPALLQILFW